MNKSRSEIRCEKFRELERQGDFPINEIKAKVAIISTPRCGSSFFSDVLRNTKSVGDPDEWFNMDRLHAYARVTNKSNININDYISFLYRKTTTENGVFSVNFHVDQLWSCAKQGFDVLSLGYTHIYYLHREDKLSQAHSLAKAMVTNNWGTKVSDSKPAPERIPISYVINRLEHIAKQEEYYNEKIRSQVLAEFSHEDFVNISETHCFKRVLSHIDVDESTPLYSSHAKQAGAKDVSAINELMSYLCKPAETDMKSLHCNEQ